MSTSPAPASAESRPIRSHTSEAPDTSRAPSRARPNPHPPAAPAPGSVDGSPACEAPASVANRRNAPSRRRTSAEPAPFCGPNIRAAPCAPSNGPRTSHATSIEQPDRSRVAADRSIVARSSRPAPPGAMSSARELASRAPNACNRPAPPSVQALPPTPTTIVRAPSPTAIRMSSPVPRDVAWSGSSDLVPSRRSPDASASSITAWSRPSQPSLATTDVPAGPVTRCRLMRASDPAARSTSSVPSPPSATGTSTACAPASRTPRAIAAAALSARKVPLNAFGAQTTRTGAGEPPEGRVAVRRIGAHGEESHRAVVRMSA